MEFLHGKLVPIIFGIPTNTWAALPRFGTPLQMHEGFQTVSSIGSVLNHDAVQAAVANLLRSIECLYSTKMLKSTVLIRSIIMFGILSHIKATWKGTVTSLKIPQNKCNYMPA